MNPPENSASTELIPSSSVILVRDSSAGLELLMLKRNSKVKSFNSTWVFPGGKLDAEELRHGRPTGERLAAVRECEEECGVEISQQELVDYSRWVTPSIMPRRFDTGFYLAAVKADANIIIDNSEIVEYCWITIPEALGVFKSGAMKVQPPAFVSAIDLLDYADTEQALSAHQELKTFQYNPKVFYSANKRMDSIYQGDAAYDCEDPLVESKKHRVVIDHEGMHYYRNNKKMY